MKTQIPSEVGQRSRMLQKMHSAEVSYDRSQNRRRESYWRKIAARWNDKTIRDEIKLMNRLLALP